jgi:hypothetical protein
MTNRPVWRACVTDAIRWCCWRESGARRPPWPPASRQATSSKCRGGAPGTVDPEQAGKEQRTLSKYLRNLQLLWNENQPKPEPKKKRRYSPRQRTLFAVHQEQIEQWLESAVTLSAAEVLRRLMALAPGHDHEGPAADDGAARQGMAGSPYRAAVGGDAIRRNGGCDRGNG